MSNFARSFKPPTALLSPRRRPGMPGRTLSNASELSLTPNSVAAYQADYFVECPVISAPNSPSLSPAIGPVLDEGSKSTAGTSEFADNSAKSTNSDPITIELPKLRKLSSSPTATPPESVSARGDLPGAYFPLYEDPKGRLRRPHPFSHEPGNSRHSRTLDSITMQTERVKNYHVSTSASAARSGTPISSYIAPGFHDAPLPVGKYYPSNYEQSHQPKDSHYLGPAAATPTLASAGKLDPHVPRIRPESSRNENSQMEMRRKMQQYQRDMIAQTAMVLGASTRTLPPEVSLNGLPIRDLWLSGSASQKPLSPRLHPLGSPGPVTPMDLEPSSSSSYIESGTKSPLPLLAKSEFASPN